MSKTSKWSSSNANPIEICFRDFADSSVDPPYFCLEDFRLDQFIHTHSRIKCIIKERWWSQQLYCISMCFKHKFLDQWWYSTICGNFPGYIEYFNADLVHEVSECSEGVNSNHCKLHFKAGQVINGIKGNQTWQLQNTQNFVFRQHFKPQI